MDENSKIIQKLKNEKIDLNKAIKNISKNLTKSTHRVQELERGIIALNNRQTDALKSFDRKHRECIDNILGLVANPNFSTLNPADRVRAVRLEYEKIILGGKNMKPKVEIIK